METKRKYTLHEPEFPTALESQNLLMAQIKVSCAIELSEIFDDMKVYRKEFNAHKIEIDKPISEPVIYFLRTKGYRVAQFQERSEGHYQRNATIEF